MLKVIVVDDEMLIRKRIVFGFEWEKMGYQIEDEAGTGAEALALMELKHYDVAIVDIAMPGMTGIELSREIKDRGYEINVIILTGHSDFTYARQSLQNGVFDYILKPIHEEEFTGSLLRLAQKIGEEKRQKVRLGQLDIVMQSKLFSDYFHGMARDEDVPAINESLCQAGIDEADKYVMILFRAEAFIKHGMEPGQQAVVFQDISREVLADRCRLITGDIYEDYLALILHYEDHLPEDYIKRCVVQINSRLRQETGATVLSGISLVHRTGTELQMAYREAFSAINNAMVLKQDVLAYQAVQDRRQVHYKIAYQELKDLQHCIGKNDFDGCQELVRMIFGEMQARESSFESILHNVSRLFMELVDMGVMSDLDIQRFFHGYHGIEQALSNMESVAEMAEWCENILFHLMENEIRTSVESKSLPIVEQACTYIRANFHDAGLNQSEIAGALAVTTSYLSGVFKKAMGITMIQYITMVRMEKARELLLDEDLDVKEVAEKTGYHDEYYFSRCFKKQYGLSPMHIKKISDSRRVRKFY